MTKTPDNVTAAIQKLDTSDQVLIQTYIAKLKSTIKDLEVQVGGEDGHAHYHGGEKCTGTHDHGHDHHTEGDCCEHGHEHSHKHEHEHEHSHDIPAWKKEAMNADPNACPFGGTWGTEASVDATEDMPPMYTGDGSGDDFDKAMQAKSEATDLKSQGLYEEALIKFNEAIVSAEPSALLLANRGHVLFKLNKYAAATRDCDAALAKNPDSAKALRIRGECHLKRGKFHDALKDLSAAQTIDFDEEAASMLKEATEKCKELDALNVKKRVEEEEKLKKRAAEIKKAQEDAKQEAEEARQRSAGAAGGMPGGMGGIPGGMGGLGGMAGMMNDPEIAAGLQNPKVMSALQELMSGPGGPMGIMSNPGKIQELMSDPEVGPFMQKMISKIGGGMGMPGGGMGMPGGFGGAGGGFGDEMPNMDGDNGSDDEMPDLVD